MHRLLPLALALACLASLALCLSPPAGADAGAGPHAHPSNGRFQLASYAPGEGLEVLDRVWGVTYVLDLRRREVAALDLLAGTIVTRALALEELQEPPAGPAPSWPRVRPLKPGEGTPRFAHLQTSGVLAGGSSVVFDEDTGRLTLVSATHIQTIDPVEGALRIRPLRAADGSGAVARLAARAQEGRARAALLEIAAAEARYRRQGTEARFGSLAELLAAKAISGEALAVSGYRFEAEQAGGGEVERRFMARAVPTGAGRWFALTERGRLFVSEREIPLAPLASMPEHARPLEEPK